MFDIKKFVNYFLTNGRDQFKDLIEIFEYYTGGKYDFTTEAVTASNLTRILEEKETVSFRAANGEVKCDRTDIKRPNCHSIIAYTKLFVYNDSCNPTPEYRTMVNITVKATNSEDVVATDSSIVTVNRGDNGEVFVFIYEYQSDDKCYVDVNVNTYYYIPVTVKFLDTLDEFDKDYIDKIKKYGICPDYEDHYERRYSGIAEMLFDEFPVKNEMVKKLTKEI